MKCLRYKITAALLLTLLSAQTSADAFDKGTVTGTIALGSGQFFNEDYYIIGVGAGYYVTDGIELGIEVDAWTGGDPSIYEIMPKISYVYDSLSKVKPYIGAFYNRTFIEDRDDHDAIGYRAGIYTPVGERTYIGVGIVYSELQSCTETIFNDCSDTRSELSIIFKL